MITINCDIGERGPDHPVDVALMNHIQIANIACGGHAGDLQSVTAFRQRADQNQVKISAHLSYPDQVNFGRFSMDISLNDLYKALDKQILLLPDVRCVKFHGALYNDSVVKRDLAAGLTDWLLKQNMKEIITPNDSELANTCTEAGLAVRFEAFAERRYAFDPETVRLTLVNRSKDYASMSDCEEALKHSRSIIKSGEVLAHYERENGELEKKVMKIEAHTICIHSDSEIALELAKGLNKLISAL